MNLSELLPIPCVSPDLMKLRSLIVDIQANWFANDFDSGLTFSNPDTWQKCQEAINLLRHRDNSSRSGFPILEIADDYERLESIFISPSYTLIEKELQLDFQGCELVQMHTFSALKVLNEAIAKRNKEIAEELEIELKAIESQAYIEVETMPEPTDEVRPDIKAAVNPMEIRNDSDGTRAKKVKPKIKAATLEDGGMQDQY